MYITPLGLLAITAAVLILLSILFIGYILWMQHLQQTTLVQWLQHSEEKLTELTGHIEELGQTQEIKHNQWGLLLEKRLSSQDAHTQHLLQLGSKIESLSTVMSHDSHRGAYGETQLSFILQDMFPSQLLTFQHTLSTLRRVDAALWLGTMERWLCIDAKFPLEDFQSDNLQGEDIKKFKSKVKKHIKDISDRYIIPGETMNMAVLFLPAEGLFLWLHHHASDILQYSSQQHVWIASPSTLPSLLHITLGLMKDHHIDQLSHQFMKEFQHLLSLTSQSQATIEKLEKSLHNHQQHLWSLAQQHQILFQNLKNMEHSHSVPDVLSTPIEDPAE